MIHISYRVKVLNQLNLYHSCNYRELGPDNILRHSQCFMFDQNNASVPCVYGWEYDKTYYESTIPSTFDWVCDKADYATGALSSGVAGSAVGTIAWGILADKYVNTPLLIGKTWYIFKFSTN